LRLPTPTLPLGSLTGLPSSCPPLFTHAARSDPDRVSDGQPLRHLLVGFHGPLTCRPLHCRSNEAQPLQRRCVRHLRPA
jgi:hypothetical protein